MLAKLRTPFTRTFTAERLYRAAVICGLAPAAIGLGVALAWTAFGWNWAPLDVLPILVIAGGIVSLVVGGLCLLAYADLAWETLPKLQIGKRAAIGSAALLASFPVSVVTAFLAPTELTVENAGPDIQALVVTGGGTRMDLGPIASGERRVGAFLVWHKDALKFHATRGGQEISGQLGGRVAPGEPSYPILVFDADGTWGSWQRDADDVGRF
ncbi:MAG TPA: hypothetical protein VMF30_15155 [Pirellulales bacterium]|nr:hypothetical protein [Pirellulales bacterium]